MIRHAELALLSLFLVAAHPAEAADYATSNPCRVPVEATPQADVAAPAESTSPAEPSLNATVELAVPLASRIQTQAYNADLSQSTVDVGTALVTQDDSYLNVLGTELSAAGDEKKLPEGCQ